LEQAGSDGGCGWVLSDGRLGIGSLHVSANEDCEFEARRSEGELLGHAHGDKAPADFAQLSIG
jgi:hypothetical protein